MPIKDFPYRRSMFWTELDNLLYSWERKKRTSKGSIRPRLWLKFKGKLNTWVSSSTKETFRKRLFRPWTPTSSPITEPWPNWMPPSNTMPAESNSWLKKEKCSTSQPMRILETSTISPRENPNNKWSTERCPSSEPKIWLVTWKDNRMPSLTYFPNFQTNLESAKKD
jgi:hypothetical protein